ncbi:peroxiredoxin [Candidatus Uhrbacteria bacterium]|nr:peroxiredoxin [Candidatus Uhrbacteria bacterium]
MEEFIEDHHTPQLASVSKPAPNFNVDAVLKSGEFGKVTLEDYKGKWLVLFFYPLDFTFVCPTEITGFSKRYAEFTALNADVLGGSTDSVHSHKAWLKDLGELNYPLFSDMTRDMSWDYGVLLPEEGVALRGTFIIDPEGVLRYALYHDLGIGRSVDETLRVLSALQTGELCPMDWSEGKDTLGKA